VEGTDYDSWLKNTRKNMFSPGGVAVFLASEELILRVSEVMMKKKNTNIVF